MDYFTHATTSLTSHGRYVGTENEISRILTDVSAAASYSRIRRFYEGRSKKPADSSIEKSPRHPSVCKVEGLPFERHLSG